MKQQDIDDYLDYYGSNSLYDVTVSIQREGFKQKHEGHIVPCKIVKETILKDRMTGLQLNEYYLLVKKGNEILRTSVRAEEILSINVYRITLDITPEKTFEIPDELK